MLDDFPKKKKITCRENSKQKIVDEIEKQRERERERVCVSYIP